MLSEAFLQRLDALQLAMRAPARGGAGGLRRSRALGSSVEFSDFREYAPGDDLRRVDWNAYARFDRLFLKLFMEEQETTVHILLDCSPSLGMLTINALTAADRIVIPVQAQYLSAKGVEQLLGTVARVKRNINHKLKIDGVLLTMVDSRTNNSKEIASLLRSTYGPKIKVFDTEIPRSVRAAEISAEGKSIFEHDPGGKVAAAYHALTKEVLHLEEQRQKHKSDLLR